MERRWKVSKKNYYPFNGEEKPQTVEESLKAFEDYENDLEKSRPASVDELKKAFRELDESKRAEEESKLRDHFAGLAMQGMMTYMPVWNQGACQADYIANHAYTIADAMLKARKEVKP